MNRHTYLVVGLMLLLGGALAAACSSSTEGLEGRIEALEHQASSEEITTLHEQLQRANMIATLNLLDDVGFHELHEAIDADGIAPAGTVGSVRTALRAVAVTDWPDDLDADAADLQAKLGRFLDSLLADEMGAPLVDASLVAHDGFHDFFDTGWAYLADQVGLDPSGEDDHDGMGMDGEMGDGMNEAPTP